MVRRIQDRVDCVMEGGGWKMTKEEQQLYWMDRAKEYAKSVATENLYQWQIDALYVAFLNGVQQALKIRLV